MDPSFPEPPPHPGGPPGQPSEPEPDRTRGLVFEETCYRHPNVQTGVHCTRCGRPICPDCMHPAPVGYQCPECFKAAVKTAPRRRWRIQFFLGRPGSITTTLLAVNIAMFLVEVVTSGGGSLFAAPSPARLVQLGAMDPLRIAEHHEYWRLLTAMFLHAGLLHILFNMYALYLFGYLIENTFGKPRFIAIYFVTGLFASAASFYFSNPCVPAVGASGAIFGLLGAWVAFNFRRRQTAFGSANLRWALFLIAFNLILGFSLRGIDNSAHIGGLVAGIVTGFTAEGFGPPSVRRAARIAGFVVLVGVAAAFTAIHAAELVRLGPTC